MVTERYVIRPEVAIHSDRYLGSLLAGGEPVRWGYHGPLMALAGRYVRNGHQYFTFRRLADGYEVDVYASYRYHGCEVWWDLAIEAALERMADYDSGR